LNVIGGDRRLVAEAATEIDFFVIHVPAAGSNGSVVGYDAKGLDAEGFDRDRYDAKGFNGLGLNKDGLTASAARAAKKAAPRVLASAPEVLRETSGVTITKEGRRLYFATPYGHRLATVVKDAGATWEAASKRWWIAAAGNMTLVEAFDALLEQERAQAVQVAERKAAQEDAAAKDLASRTWIAIPFEAAEVREFAKSNGAKWNPQTKSWGLAAEAVEAVKASLSEWKTAQLAAAPLDLYAFSYKRALTEFEWKEGETIWSHDHDAFVTLVTVKRRWRSGEEDDGSEDEAGFSYTATGRLATTEEITALRAQQKERNS
jgi:3D (Asp-Asp-Asp) domain-containing protein